MARRRGQRKGYLFEKSGTWYIRYRVDTAELDGAGKPVRERLTQQVGPSSGPGSIGKREATRLAWELVLSKLDQSAIRPGSAMTVQQFYERFEIEWMQNLEASTQSQYRSLFRLHILPGLGTMQLREVSLAHVQNLIRVIQTKTREVKVDGKSVQTKLSWNTIKHVRKCTSALFHHAKKSGLIAENPVENVRMPVKRVKEKSVPTWEQVCAIARAIPAAIAGRSNWDWKERAAVFQREASEVSTLVLILAVTGMRIGEAMGLKWRRVNLTAAPVMLDGELIPPYCLAIRETWGMGAYGTPKTERSRRFIPLASWAVVLLEEMKQRVEHVAANDPVWAGSTGKPLDQHNAAKRILKPAGKLAGFPSISWHGFRHANATMTNELLTVAERQKILGHTSSEMTNHYTHTDLEKARAGLEKIKPTLQ